MVSDLSEAMNPLSAGKGEFIGQLVEKFGTKATVKTVYGDPIEHGEMTIIPVAKVLYGAGGGEGDKRGYGGAGGGGGIKVTPIGYIELKNGESKFRPIRNLATTIAFIVAGSIAGVLLMRGFGSLFSRSGRLSRSDE